jgi:integrase
MPTFKALVLAHQRRQDGKYNIKIRLTHRKQVKYIATPWYVGASDLTRSLKIRNRLYSDMCDALIRDFQDRVDRLGVYVMDMSAGEIAALLMRREDEPGRFRLDVFGYVRRHMERLVGEGRGGNARTFGDMLSALMRYTGGDTLDVNDVTVTFLKEWLQWLMTDGEDGRRRCMASTARNYMAKFRAVFNMIRDEYNDEDAGVMNVPRDPFRRVEKPRGPKPAKRAITREQLLAIAALPDVPSQGRYYKVRNVARDMFLLSFMLQGMNAADLYSATDYSGGRITYERTKTRRRREDGALISVKVVPAADRIIGRYRDPRGEYVLGVGRHYASLATFNTMLSRGMKEVGEAIGVPGLQFYAARHTWATIGSNEAGVDKYVIHEGLNHADPEMKTTDVYIRRDWEPIDRANRQILDYVGIEDVILSR